MNKGKTIEFMKWVDAVFPPFKDTERVKPKNMLYVAHETPSLGTSIAVGGQHAVVLLMLVIYTVIVGREVGLSEGQLRGFVSVEIIAAGIATLLLWPKEKDKSPSGTVSVSSAIGNGVYGKITW